MNLPEILRFLRESQHLTRQQLADETGLSFHAISSYENGRREPNSKAMAALERYFNVSGEYLRGEVETIAPSGQITPPRAKKAPPDLSEEALKLAGDYEKLNEKWRSVIRFIVEEGTSKSEEKAVRYVVPLLRPALNPPVPEPVYYTTSRYTQPMSAGTGAEAGDDGPEDFMLSKQPPRGTSFVAPVSGDSMEPTFHDGDELFVHACSDIEPGRIGVFFMDGKQWVKELGDGVLISHNPAYAPIPITPDIRCQGLVLGVCDPSYFG